MTTRKIMAGSVLAFIIVCGAARAQSEAQPGAIAQLVTELNSARAQQAAASGTEHAAADSRIESSLKQLIDAAPADPRAPTWMLDLASLHLAIATRDCDDASVMFGISTAEQSRRVAASAAAATTLINRADAAAQSAVAALEAKLLEPGLDADRAAALSAQIEPVLAQLVDVEVALRIPMLRLDAAVLVAIAEKDSAASPGRRADALTLVAKAPAAGTAAEVHKRLLAASLLVRSADAQQRDAVRRQIEWIVGNAVAPAASQSDGDLTPGDWVRLHMALIRCGQADAGAKLRCPGRGTDWLVDLLLAESHVAEALAVGGAASPSPRLAGVLGQLLAVARKYDGPEALLDSPEPLGELRAKVYEKLARATGPGSPWATLDPEIALARAWSLRDATGRLDAEGAALLRQVADRKDAAEALRARALWVLAEHSGGSEQDRVTSSRGYCSRLVHELPQSQLAASAAFRIFDAWYTRVRPSSPCDLEWADARERDEVAAALPLLLASRPPAHPLHVNYIGVLLSGKLPATPEELEKAVSAFRGMGAASNSAPELSACITQAVEQSLAESGDPRTRDRIFRLAAAWFADRGESGRQRSLSLRFERAEAALAAKLEAADAIADELRALLETSVDAQGSSDRARLRTALGIALRAAGEADAAVLQLRSVADEYEADARATDAARASARQAFWNVWAELLEIVRSGEADNGNASEDDRARQTQRLRERLELLDPDLGGEPWAGRIRAASSAKDK